MYLSGGVDSTSISDSNIEDLLNLTDFPIDVTHIIFLSPITSSGIDYINTHLSDPNNQPRLFMFNAPNYTQPTSSWLIDVYNNFPERSNMIAATVGDTFVTLDGKQMERYSVESIATALAKNDGYNITNIPLSVDDFTPNLSETDLEYCKAMGFVAVTRHIKNDISTYQGTVTSTENSFVYSSKIAEIVSITVKYCSYFYGKFLNEGPQPSIANSIRNKLLSLSFFELQSVDVNVIDDSMIVSVEGILPSEILKISFSVKNK
jgi:hypothetical protein